VAVHIVVRGQEAMGVSHIDIVKEGCWRYLNHHWDYIYLVGSQFQMIYMEIVTMKGVGYISLTIGTAYCCRPPIYVFHLLLYYKLGILYMIREHLGLH
jgi:hypothetical protein